MRTFWLFMLILGGSCCLVNVVAFDVTNHWSHFGWALYGVCFAGYSGRRLSTYE